MDKFEIEKSSFFSLKEKKKKEEVRERKKKLLEEKIKLFGPPISKKLNSESLIEDTINALRSGEHSQINRDKRMQEISLTEY